MQRNTFLKYKQLIKNIYLIYIFTIKIHEQRIFSCCTKVKMSGFGKIEMSGYND